MPSPAHRGTRPVHRDPTPPPPCREGVSSCVDISPHRPQCYRHHGLARSIAAIADLVGEAASIGERRSHHTSSSLLRHERRQRPHPQRDISRRSSDQFGACSHRAGDRRPGRSQRSERRGELSERERVGRRATTVDADVRDDRAERLDSGGDRNLQRVGGIEVAVDLPTIDTAGGQHRSVFARAILLKRRRPDTGSASLGPRRRAVRARRSVREVRLVEAMASQGRTDGIEVQR